ncbi:hypothetical protein DIPPA_25730 [Diplonema papillatum]|nr:hypothetical protein DIPPA_25730 [Diplonema papillatum]
MASLKRKAPGFGDPNEAPRKKRTRAKTAIELYVADNIKRYLRANPGVPQAEMRKNLREVGWHDLEPEERDYWGRVALAEQVASTARRMDNQQMPPVQKRKPCPKR